MLCDFRFFSGLASENIVPSSFHSPGHDYLFDSFLVAVDPVHREVMVGVFDMLEGNFCLLSGDSHLAEGLNNVLNLHLPASEPILRGLRSKSFHDLSVLRFQDLIKFRK